MKNSCEQCYKKHKLKSGLNSHQKNKHGNGDHNAIIVHCLQFAFDERGTNKLSIDECFYSKENRFIFKNLTLTLEECAPIHKVFEPLLNSFNGNAEKVYSEFYKLSWENVIFKDFLNKELSMLLCCEISTICLEYLTERNRLPCRDITTEDKIFFSLPPNILPFTIPFKTSD